MPYRRIPPKKWPALDEVTRLAREHTVEAMQKLIGLMESDSHFVRVTAARSVLLQGRPGSLRSPRLGSSAAPKPEQVSVKIARFKGEKRRGTDERDRKLPVVQGRRKGSRELEPGDEAGLPEVRRKRPDLCDEP
jgi:hypothetical protein